MATTLQPLPYAPPLEPDETLWSWLTRVALYHGWSSDKFLMLLGFGERPWESYFRQRDVDSGSPQELIDRLAEVTGFRREHIASHALQRSASTLWLDDRVAFCESCWSVNPVPYIRRAWVDAWCIDCPIHGQPLVTIPPVRRPRHAPDWNAAWSCRADWAQGARALYTPGGGASSLIGRQILISRPPGAFERANAQEHGGAPRHARDCADRTLSGRNVPVPESLERRLVLLAGRPWGEFSLVRAFFDIREGLAWRNTEHGYDAAQPITEPLGSLEIRSGAIRIGRSLFDILLDQPYREPRIADPLRRWMGGLFNSPRRWLMHELATWPSAVKESWKQHFEWGDEFEWIRCAHLERPRPRSQVNS